MCMIKHDLNDHDMQMLTLKRQRVLWRLNGEYILNTSNSISITRWTMGRYSNLGVAHNKRIYPRVLVSLDFNGDFCNNSVKVFLQP